ncbi:MAG: hypothetical protein ACE5NC_06700 [Anaerolineae bacterium]
MRRDSKEQRLGRLRYGLLVFMAIALSVSLTAYYVALAPLAALDIIARWTVVFVLASGIVTALVFFSYSAYLDRTSPGSGDEGTEPPAPPRET